MDGYQLTTFVVAKNSEGEPELFAFDISATQEQVDNGEHYDRARIKAEAEGYTALTAFDSSDMAGRQLLGKSPMHGDDLHVIQTHHMMPDLLEAAGNTRRSEPTIGAVGFYRPDPGHKKSPNVVLGVNDSKLMVFEVPTRMVFDIDRDDWMSLNDMRERIFEVIGGHPHNGGVMSDIGDDILKGYVAAMADAVRIAQEIPGIIAKYAASLAS